MEYFNSVKEAGDYLREHYKENINIFVNALLEKANDGKSYVCPKCGNGSHHPGDETDDGVKEDPTSDKMYKCFSEKCKLYTDVFGLIMEKEKGTTYYQAVKKFGDYVGFDFRVIGDENYNKEPIATTKPKTQNKPITADNTEQQKDEADDQEAIKAKNKWIIENSRKNFTENGEAMKYLKKRGFTFDICKKFGFGFNSKKESVIIPTSENSYIYRSVNSKNRGNSRGKNNQHLFNEDLFYNLLTKDLFRFNDLDDRLFICEGWADALSLIQSGFQAIALNSTNNAEDLFLDEIKKNKDSFSEDFFFLIALDNDEAGKETAEKIMAELKELGINSANVTSFLLFNENKTYKDINEAYIDNREQIENRANEIYKNPNSDIVLRVYHDEIDCINCVNDFENDDEKPREEAISTGFESLNKVLYGGFFTGLYIMGAVSSLGKTSFALQITSNIAEAGKDVLIFSLEMSKRELLAKIISRFTFENNRDFARNTIEILNNFTSKDDEAKAIEQRKNRKEALKRLKNFADKIFIFEGIGDITVEQIREKIEKHIKITGNTPFVLIDYAQIISPVGNRTLTDKQVTDKNITELRKISRDFNCVVFAISSFNRESYKEEVSLTSFKESGAIEYSSDVLIGMQYKALARKIEKHPKTGEPESETDSQYNKRKQLFYIELEEKRSKGEFLPLQVKILKNRNGRIGKTDIYFKPPYNYFTDDVNLTKNDFESPFDI